MIKLLSVPTIILIATVISSCSKENKPSTDELQTSLSFVLPAYIIVEDFSIEASQNFGNQVEPIYGVRFKALIKTNSDLYKIDKKDEGVTFVNLSTKEGVKTDIFGKITSRLYQGVWKHSVDIDGNPLNNLGIPLNLFSDSHLIIRGSAEEKKYYAEMELKEAELRKNISNAQKILIGTWRDNNSLLIYKSDGTIYVKQDAGSEGIGIWRIENDLIIKDYKKVRRANSNWENLTYNTTGKIIYIGDNNYEIEEGGKLWTGKRIK